MKTFWHNDSLCLKVENDAERNALKLVLTALLQTTEVEAAQAPGVCPGANLVEITNVRVADKAQSICNSLTRMQSLLSVYDLTQSRIWSAIEDVRRAQDCTASWYFHRSLRRRNGLADRGFPVIESTAVATPSTAQGPADRRSA